MREIRWKPDMDESEYALYVLTCVYLHVDPLPQDWDGKTEADQERTAPEQNKTL